MIVECSQCCKKNEVEVFFDCNELGEDFTSLDFYCSCGFQLEIQEWGHLTNEELLSII